MCHLRDDAMKYSRYLAICLALLSVLISAPKEVSASLDGGLSAADIRKLNRRFNQRNIDIEDRESRIARLRQQAASGDLDAQKELLTLINEQIEDKKAQRTVVFTRTMQGVSFFETQVGAELHVYTENFLREIRNKIDENKIESDQLTEDIKNLQGEADTLEASINAADTAQTEQTKIKNKINKLRSQASDKDSDAKTKRELAKNYRKAAKEGRRMAGKIDNSAENAGTKQMMIDMADSNDKEANKLDKQAKVLEKESKALNKSVSNMMQKQMAPADADNAPVPQIPIKLDF